jgi:hypothetical protein
MAQPTITSFAPTSIPANAGGVVVITGTNFNTAAVTAVTVNGATASFVVTNDTTLTVTVPNALPGVATVAVTNPTGTATNNSGLTVTAYVVPTYNNILTPTGVFDTSGTSRFTNNLDDQYLAFNSKLWSNAASSYSAYLEKVAKINAVILHNTRYNPDLAVPTF